MPGELKYKDLTEKIIKASFEVHKFLGNGFFHKDAFGTRSYLSKDLARELDQAGLSYSREIEQEIFYKEMQDPIGTSTINVEAKEGETTTFTIELSI